MLIQYKHITSELLDHIPEFPELTGFNFLDFWKTRFCKQELQNYFTEKVEYTGEIINYSNMLSYIDNLCAHFINLLAKDIPSVLK